MNNEVLSTIDYDTSKKYKDLEPHDYFVGKIKIIELARKYALTEEIHKKLSSKTFEKVDINVFKAEGYIPGIHSQKDLKIGKTYDIRGFMNEDRYLHIHYIKELEDWEELITETMDKSIIGISKVTRNGQITLSRKVLNELGVEIGDYIIFEKIEGNKLFILPGHLNKRWNNGIHDIDI